MIHVYYGDGKGKTTAAMGLALRMLAAGGRVVIVQFLKDGGSGEVRMLSSRFGVPVFACAPTGKFTWEMTNEELAAVRKAHDKNLAAALDEVEALGAWLLVLDEVLDALAMGLVDESVVTRVLDLGTGELEVVLTGRNPSEDIASHADYLTEMKCRKHPFEQGVPSREGVEY